MHDVFYTDVFAARAELEQRRQDVRLKQEVEQWWQSLGCGIPELPQDDGHLYALLARQVATARYEDIVFKFVAEAGGLAPLWGSYTGDKFSVHSAYKKSLVDPFIIDGRGRSGGPRRVCESGRLVTNIEACAGRPINSLRSKKGQSIVEWHLARQDLILPGVARTPDMTTWFQKIGRAKQYYAPYLAMALFNCVIVEDFHDWDDCKEEKFAKEVFEPAFQQVEQTFGVKPLIVRLPWWEEMAWYPANSNWEDHKIIALDGRGLPIRWQPEQETATPAQQYGQVESFIL